MSNWRERVSFSEALLNKYFVHDEKTIFGRNSNIEAAVEGQSQLLLDLVAHWDMDEAAGENRADSGGGLDLVDNGTIAQGVGNLNNAADVENTSGDSEYFSVDDSTILDFGNSSFSFSVWVNLESKGQNRVILSKWNSQGDQRQYKLEYNSSADRFRWSVSSNGQSGASTTVLDNDSLGSPFTGTWYLLTVYHDADENEIGISHDSSPFVTAAHSGGVHSGSGADFRVGSAQSGSSEVELFDGLIDELGAWGRALSKGEKDEYFNSGAGLAYPFTGVLPVTGSNLYEGIWSASTAFAFPEVALPLRIRPSASAEDSSAGLGAREIVVQGIDENGDFAEETLVPNGTSESASTSTNFIRVNKVLVTKSGSYNNANFENIDVETTSGVLMARIAAGEGSSQLARFATDRENAVLIKGFAFFVAAGDTVTFRIYQNDDFRDTTIPDSPRNLVAQLDNVQGNLDFQFGQPLIIPAGGEVWVDVLSDDMGGASASVLFSGQIAHVRN